MVAPPGVERTHPRSIPSWDRSWCCTGVFPQNLICRSWTYAWSHNGSTTCPSSAESMGTSSISRRTRGVCIVCIGLAYTLGCVLCACGGVCGCVGVCVQILQLYLSCPGSKKKKKKKSFYLLPAGPQTLPPPDTKTPPFFFMPFSTLKKKN